MTGSQTMTCTILGSTARVCAATTVTASLPIRFFVAPRTTTLALPWASDVGKVRRKVLVAQNLDLALVHLLPSSLTTKVSRGSRPSP